MKAKELKEAAIQYYYGYPATQNDEGYYSFLPNELQAFCEQLCREQREICAKIPLHGFPSEIEERCINAPIPEL
jgi:hypothetical protein